jgi:hypothetical protein
MKTSTYLKRSGRGLIWALGLLSLSVVVQAAWNMVVPEVFGLIPLRYPQAIALLVLAGISAGLLRFVLGAGRHRGPRHSPRGA